MTKKKIHADYYQSDLHAISPLPLPVIISQIMTLSLPDSQFIILHEDSDRMLFRIEHHTRAGNTNVIITGQARRWQGTQTRVDIDSEMKLSWQLMQWVLQMTFVLGITSVTAGLLWSLWRVYPTILGLSATIILPLSFVLLRAIWRINLIEKQRYTAMRDIDSLMQQIADALTDPTHRLQFVSADESDDQLAQLLRRDTAAPSLEADGELPSSPPRPASERGID